MVVWWVDGAGFVVWRCTLFGTRMERVRLGGTLIGADFYFKHIDTLVLLCVDFKRFTFHSSH
jgi:hypothetical protein